MEVWMDEYKEYVYKRRPGYRDVDAGDITKQKALREKLKCKSFNWFMKEVAFDQEKHYPAVEPDDFAYGKIESLARPGLCVKEGVNSFEVATCSSERRLEFQFGYKKDVHAKNGPCMDVSQGGERAPVGKYPCHGGGGNQLWKYDLVSYPCSHLLANTIYCTLIYVGYQEVGTRRG